MTPAEKRHTLLGALDLRAAKGLEIGPLHHPIVRKSEGDVLYVDHAGTEDIRNANVSRHFSRAEIVPIDLVWGAQPLRELVPQAVDYVVAAHVIEHVPDPITWLLDLRGALVERGVAGLVVPDRRFTFDMRRPESTAGEIIEAHLLRAKRAPPRHLFDQLTLAVSLERSEAWDPAARKAAHAQSENVAHAYQRAARLAATAEYADTHCWIFTPGSFLDVAETLAQVGLFPFTIDNFHPTEVGEYEFYVRLKTVASPTSEEIRASIAAARSKLENWPPEHAYRTIQLHELAGQTDTARGYEARIARLQAIIQGYETSNSWRMTRPLRSVRRWLGV